MYIKGTGKNEALAGYGSVSYPLLEPMERLSSMCVEILTTSFLAVMDCFVYRMCVLNSMYVFRDFDYHMVSPMTEIDKYIN